MFQSFPRLLLGSLETINFVLRNYLFWNVYQSECPSEVVNFMCYTKWISSTHPIMSYMPSMATSCSFRNSPSIKGCADSLKNRNIAKGNLLLFYKKVKMTLNLN